MPGPVQVCLWYDTEDFVTPASDDAAKRLAALHSRLELPATFKVVGEKARRLRSRRRQDVIDAIAEHDVGYHTDLHSVHPVVTEYCERLTWAEGVSEFQIRETRGFDQVSEIFNRQLSTYGQAGGSWAPQVYPALRQWGIRTYVDEGPWIGLDERPFWYMGLLHVMRMGPNATRFSLRQPGDELDGVVRFDGALRRLAAGDGGVISIYFHPCEWVTERFWDAVNYAGGANPPIENLTTPALTDPAEVERRFAATELYLRHIAESRARPITCADLVKLYPDRALGVYYTPQALVEASADWEDTVNFLPTEAGWLSAGELLSVVAGLLRSRGELAPGSAGRVARALRVDGPSESWPALAEPMTVSFSDLVDASDYILARITPEFQPDSPRPDAEAAPPPCPSPRLTLPLPTTVPLGMGLARPDEYLAAALRALRSIVTFGSPPEEVVVRPVGFLPAEHVRHDPDAFSWCIFPPGFDAPRVMAHARRQAWTLKPALRDPSLGA